MSQTTLSPDTRNVVDRLEHVHLAVLDLDASIAFYTALFGWQVRHDEVGPNGRCAHVGTDRFYVALSERPHLFRAPGGRGTFFHFGCTTPLSRDRFEARLAAAGVEPDSVSTRPEGWAIYVLDPDGHEIEVVGYRPDSRYARSW